MWLALAHAPAHAPALGAVWPHDGSTPRRERISRNTHVLHLPSACCGHRRASRQTPLVMRRYVTSPSRLGDAGIGRPRSIEVYRWLHSGPAGCVFPHPRRPAELVCTFDTALFRKGHRRRGRRTQELRRHKAEKPNLSDHSAENKTAATHPQADNPVPRTYKPALTQLADQAVWHASCTAAPRTRAHTSFRLCVSPKMFGYHGDDAGDGANRQSPQVVCAVCTDVCTITAQVVMGTTPCRG